MKPFFICMLGAAGLVVGIASFLPVEDALTLSRLQSMCSVPLMLVLWLSLRKREVLLAMHIKEKEALRQSEERFQLVMAASNDGIWDWPDMSKNQEFWSPQWKALLGYEDHELKATASTFFGTLLHPDDCEACEAAVSMSIETRKSFNIEHRIKTKSGAYRWFNSRAAVTQDKQTTSLRMVGTLTDIHGQKEAAFERQELLDRLRQKNEELDKFVHAAAHDLKEPVRTMRCFAMLLKSESVHELAPAGQEYVQVIENTAQRAERMINDLLGYNQVIEGTIQMEPCDCDAEMQAVLEDLASAVDAHKPTILLAPLPVIYTIPSMFRRVMLNLIDNAIKYRRQDAAPVIHVHAEQRSESWIFHVRDNGIGIPRENIGHVFEPFTRLQPSIHKEGNGIGLTSCKKIIERLGGKIWIDSDEAVGTTVYFSLPIKTA